MAGTGWSQHKKLVVVWAGLDFLYFASAVVLITFVFAWRGLGPADTSTAAGFTLKRIVIAEMDVWVGLSLSGYIICTSLFSLLAFSYTRKPGKKPTLYTVFNGTLITAILSTVAAGTAIWFFSLRQVHEFETVFRDLDPGTQAFIQDWFQCCGYYNASIAGIFTSPTGFCASAEVAANATFATPCVKPMTAYSDNTLNNVFSTVYGMVAVQCCLFLATACMRVDKLEEERFRKIDEKHGVKGGFV